MAFVPYFHCSTKTPNTSQPPGPKHIQCNGGSTGKRLNALRQSQNSVFCPYRRRRLKGTWYATHAPHRVLRRVTQTLMGDHRWARCSSVGSELFSALHKTQQTEDIKCPIHINIHQSRSNTPLHSTPFRTSNPFAERLKRRCKRCAR